VSNSIKKITKARLFLGVLAASFTFGTASVVAQDNERTGSVPQNLGKLTTQLNSIDGTFKQIESSPRSRTDMAGEQFERQQAAYASGMYDIYINQLQSVALFAKTNGKEGSINGITQFEVLAKAHETRLRQLNERGKRLQPAGGTPVSMQVPVRLTPVAWSPIDLIIPRAHAAIALTVVIACKQPVNATVCAAATAKAIVDGKIARQQFDACWAKYEGTRPKWWRAILRAGCTATFVARLA